MAYSCTTEQLLRVLATRVPRTAALLREKRRIVDHGLLSVGLKLHLLGDTGAFDELVEMLGGNTEVFEKNMYRHQAAHSCMVLPPFGSARAAILLIECLEEFTGCPIFGNPLMQLQVCSPGRLDASASALLAISFYLTSDTLRRYACEDFETTASGHYQYQRGKRIVIHDASGGFTRKFRWWREIDGQRVTQKRLPFSGGRTDLLIGSGSSADVANINLFATLLVHRQYSPYQGYWRTLGARFESDMRELLDRHLLSGLVAAPWVKDNTEATATEGDAAFYAALKELTTTAFADARRLYNRQALVKKFLTSASFERIDSILEEARSLQAHYRRHVASELLHYHAGELP